MNDAQRNQPIDRCWRDNLAATNVTVNTSNAVLYLDKTFASTNHLLVDGKIAAVIRGGLI
ncbi:MAG: hypothetical protein ACR2H1_04630 [Limisphaerales bacterium]